MGPIGHLGTSHSAVRYGRPIMWIELCMGVGAPHVSGVGGLGEFGSDLLCLCGVDANELAFAGEEVGCIRERAYAVEAMACVWHGGWSNAYALLGAMGEC